MMENCSLCFLCIFYLLLIEISTPPPPIYCQYPLPFKCCNFSLFEEFEESAKFYTFTFSSKRLSQKGVHAKPFFDLYKKLAYQNTRHSFLYQGKHGARCYRSTTTAYDMFLLSHALLFFVSKNFQKTIDKTLLLLMKQSFSRI